MVPFSDVDDGCARQEMIEGTSRTYQWAVNPSRSVKGSRIPGLGVVYARPGQSLIEPTLLSPPDLTLAHLFSAVPKTRSGLGLA